MKNGISLLIKRLEVQMNQLKAGNKIKVVIITFAMVVGFSSIIAMLAHSHGGKTLDEEAFTAFQALQKATQLRSPDRFRKATGGVGNWIKNNKN